MFRVLTLIWLLSIVPHAGAATHENAAERVGLLKTQAGDTCVATLIDDDVVLTAAHCLYDARERKVSPRHLTFHRRSNRSIRASAIISHPDFEPNVGETLAAIAADSAIVVLKYPAGDIGPIPVGSMVYSGDRVVIGRQRNRSMLDCAVVGVDGSIFTLDCRVSPGDSGAPVFRALKGGRYEIIGVVSAFETEGKAHTAIASEIDIDFHALRRALAGER